MTPDKRKKGHRIEGGTLYVGFFCGELCAGRAGVLEMCIPELSVSMAAVEEALI